ncbi:MAG: MoaD/ThiS family protein [Dehalococcoidia bacterium]|nr:MoaD/ThiS family protein [Dehalococcoidia bacterium]
MPVVFLPFNLRKYAGGARQVVVTGKTLGELIAAMETLYPGMSAHLLEEGRLRPGLVAVCGTTETRQGLRQQLDEDTEVHFIQAISGGA